MRPESGSSLYLVGEEKLIYLNQTARLEKQIPLFVYRMKRHAKLELHPYKPS